MRMRRECSKEEKLHLEGLRKEKHCIIHVQVKYMYVCMYVCLFVCLIHTSFRSRVRSRGDYLQ
jgi:hypothetical protein